MIIDRTIRIYLEAGDIVDLLNGINDNAYISDLVREHILHRDGVTDNAELVKITLLDGKDVCLIYESL